MKNLADVQMPGDVPAKDTSLSGVQMFEPIPVKKVVKVAAKRPDYRAPTKDEQINAWERLAFQINLRRSVNESVLERQVSTVETCLKRIDAFVNAHNGHLRSAAEIKQDVIQAFWEQISETPTAGLTQLVAVDVETAPKKAPVKRAPAKKRKKSVKTTGAKRGRKPKVAVAA